MLEEETPLNTSSLKSAIFENEFASTFSFNQAATSWSGDLCTFLVRNDVRLLLDLSGTSRGADRMGYTIESLDGKKLKT